MSENRLDRAIDGAVRDIMRMDAPADLEACVLARLSATERRPQRWPRFVIASAAAALVLALGLALLRTSIIPSPQTVRFDPAPASVAKTGTPPPTPARSPVPVVRGEARRERVRPVSAADVEISTIPALEEIDPLVIVPPLARDIESAPLAIAPMAAIADVQIEAPLLALEGRN